ncbi:hypothetical protein PUN4_180102 [Paraburkholderia unamae]|nr:hypothetical protein PUN4_180102 [Paraburkholderia unamae]
MPDSSLPVLRPAWRLRKFASWVTYKVVVRAEISNLYWISCIQIAVSITGGHIGMVSMLLFV